MYNLFLDDIRIPLDAYYYTFNEVYEKLEWVIVRSYGEFVAHIEANGLPNLVSFDHDLADEHYNYLEKELDFDYNGYKEKTGYECVKWMVEYCLDNREKTPKCLYHTQNLIGGINMRSYIENFLKYQ